MTTISIPYFNLSEPEIRSGWSNQVWNEIRVPLSSETNHLGRSDRSLPISHEIPVLAPNSKAAAPASAPSRPQQNALERGATLPTSRAMPLADRLKGGPSQPTSDLTQPAGLTQNDSRKKLAENTRVFNQPTQAIDRLTQCILDRFPIAGPTIILFAGTQSNPQTSATCANVAHSLANKSVGKILLIDSSSTRELTKNYQAVDHRGLSNLLQEPAEWKSTLIGLSTSALDFLPSGNSHWEHWGAENKLRGLAVQLRRDYQYICVAADEPQDANSRIWTSLCDGSFLLVSLTTANQAIAESAVVELQTSGARLLGCVVTDADTLLP